MLDSLITPDIVALVKIIFIDLVMSGDNAIIIGLAAAGLPPELRKKAIIYGIVGATVLRIIFALAVFQLLSITGIMLAGGLLLLWVCCCCSHLLTTQMQAVILLNCITAPILGIGVKDLYKHLCAEEIRYARVRDDVPRDFGS